MYMGQGASGGRSDSAGSRQLTHTLDLALPDNVGALVHLEKLSFCKSRLAHVPVSYKRPSPDKHLTLAVLCDPKIFSRLCSPTLIALIRCAYMCLFVCGLMACLQASIGELQALQHLRLTGGEFETLPADMGDLLKLQYLDLGNCKKLTALPSSFAGLSELFSLEISCCSELESLPLDGLVRASLARCRLHAPITWLPLHPPCFVSFGRRVGSNKLCMTHGGVLRLYLAGGNVHAI